MIRTSVGLTSIVLCVLFSAQALGLIPDRHGAVVEGRRALAESLAVHCSLSARQNDLGTMRFALEAVARRNADVAGATVRGADGKLLVSAGGTLPGNDAPSRASTEDHMRVPLTLDG